MRRSIRASVLIAFLALALTASAASADPGRVRHRELIDTGSVILRRVCPFPVVLAWEAIHKFTGRFESSDARSDEQLWGRHSVQGVDIWTNPANGLTVTARYAGPLIRTDFEFHFTYDSDAVATGYFTAIDHYSGNYIATVPGRGTVVHAAGHALVYHTSFIVDGVRVGRIDDIFFNAGPVFDLTELCEYLAG